MILAERHKLACLRSLLRPIVRFALRHSISVQQLIETLKHAVVELGAEEMTRRGAKVNVSRLSAMTGLHRRDVSRLLEAELTPDLPVPVAARVVGQWENDRRFTGKSGRPRVLRTTPEKNEFVKLLAAVRTDLNPGTVLFELERLGVIERRADSIKLLQRHVVTKGDVLEGFRVLEQDADDLIHTVEENVLGESTAKTLHARTEYDNISELDLPAIRDWLLEEGAKFHRKTREFLSKFDLDSRSQASGEFDGTGGCRVSVSSFGRIEKPM